MTTTNAVAHRAGQARRLALGAQLAWTLTQLLLWLSMIGGLVAVALWARRRLTAGAQRAAASAIPSSQGPIPDGPRRPGARPGR